MIGIRAAHLFKGKRNNKNIFSSCPPPRRRIGFHVFTFSRLLPLASCTGGGRNINLHITRQTNMAFTTATSTTTSLRVLVGAVALMTSARAALTMTKAGGYESLSENPFEVVVVKSSTNVSYTGLLS